MRVIMKDALGEIKTAGGVSRSDYFGQTFDSGEPKLERWIGSIVIGATIGAIVGGLTAGPPGVVVGIIDGGIKAACTQGIIQGINGTQEQYKKIKAKTGESLL